MNRRTILAGLLAAAVLPFAACGDDDDVTTPTPTPGSSAGDIEVLQSSLARVATSPGDAAAAADALNQFAFDLYREVGGGDENTVFSPYSIAIALAMTRNGAVGQTLEEMTAVLHAGDGYDESMNALDQALNSRAGEYRHGSDGETVSLEINTANQLFGQDAFPFHDAFLDALATNYGAGMRILDFAQTEAARGAINQWVSDQTSERIPELLQPDVIDSSTRLVLTNAIYLKAPWALPFMEGETRPGPFTTASGNTVQADMMRLSYKLQYATGDGFQAFELPYVDGSLGMVVIVPDHGEFDAVRRSLSPAVLDSTIGAFETVQLNLQFPAFEFRTPTELNVVLGELGMPTAFDSAGADFSAMSPQGDSLYISAVVHEAFIAVTEWGTEAAAATAVAINLSGVPQTVDLVVDRPFFFLIRDAETGAIVFMGQVTNPTK